VHAFLVLGPLRLVSGTKKKILRTLRFSNLNFLI
jgi:hypothetical protein